MQNQSSSLYDKKHGNGLSETWAGIPVLAMRLCRAFDSWFAKQVTWCFFSLRQYLATNDIQLKLTCQLLQVMKYQAQGLQRGLKAFFLLLYV